MVINYQSNHKYENNRIIIPFLFYFIIECFFLITYNIKVPSSSSSSSSSFFSLLAHVYIRGWKKLGTSLVKGRITWQPFITFPFKISPTPPYPTSSWFSEKIRN